MKLTIDTLIELNAAAELLFQAIPSQDQRNIEKDIETLQRDPKQMMKLTTGLYRLRANIAVMKQCETDIRTVQERKGIVQVIFETVCDHYSILPSDLRSKSRLKSIARARHVCIYVMRKQTTMSLHDIGTHFGTLHHSTIIHAVGNVEKDVTMLELADNVIKRVKMMME
jgi:chromosomal replication initiation ATPase DnaA